MVAMEDITMVHNGLQEFQESLIQVAVVAVVVMLGVQQVMAAQVWLF